MVPATPSPSRLLAERIELPRDEVELCGKIPQDEVEDGVAIVHVGGRRAEQREREQEKREQRQQRVVRDRRRVREIVAACRSQGSRASADIARQPRRMSRIAPCRWRAQAPIMSGRARRLHPGVTHLGREIHRHARAEPELHAARRQAVAAAAS